MEFFVVDEGMDIHKTFTIEKGDTFLVTGVDRNGKRFKRFCGNNYHYAKGINVWRGSLWLIRNGKRKLIRRTYNW